MGTPDNGTAIKAIETRYAGCHFRSRLEARWAVFFDTLGVEWQYEPQGYQWDAAPAPDDGWGTPISAGTYLPDFWLPSVDAWFEVKGRKITDQESKLYFDFSRITGKRHLTAYGDIPREEELDGSTGNESMLLDGGSDFPYRWCVCPWCGKVGAEFDGRGGRVCPGMHDCVGPCTGDDCSVVAIEHYQGRPSDKAYTFDNERILAAYEAARSARFEHGQSGAPAPATRQQLGDRARRRSTPQWSTYRRGQKVYHPSFGRGYVTEVRGSGDAEEVSVVFEPPTGTKHLAVAWAPLVAAT